ncbi:MAG: head completion/stabilization protein [Thiohalomonadaceae bacterium]
MSVFAPTVDPNSTAGQVVANIAFFPAVQVDAFRATTRLQDTVTDGRVLQALREAVISVNGELRAWREQHVALGYASLASVPADRYGDMTELEHHYLTAVYANAKALLMEQYRDIDSTEAGNRRAAEFDGTVESWRREAREAIRAMLGVPRATVELI